MDGVQLEIIPPPMHTNDDPANTVVWNAVKIPKILINKSKEPGIFDPC